MTPSDGYIFRHGDPRMSVYPMMDTPIISYSLIAAYLLFVKIVGPMWMKNRQPYEIRTTMIVYNLLTSVLNAWIFYNFASYGWFGKYRLPCEPIDYSKNKDAVKMVQICWIFFASKFVEFADTIFAVLRKKDSQISKFHVFHHCFAPATIWYLIKYGPGGYNTFLMIQNSFIHIWMYLYYCLAALGPKIQKYLWWKKYLTVMQLIQFITGMSYMTYLTFSHHGAAKYLYSSS
ncbi:elongation of very long chain fatty acids protein AAEL008004 [Caerostris darwini]|uniref:Elongation of very long chain fatty acids protein n=1 Tax=Caerostris darwini TaxID=1538125 RepID=A0AAV4SY30_9ARAC|nr:elongation of very long chain fatty acids protein AAEL008004 [Caerostris darwini]